MKRCSRWWLGLGLLFGFVHAAADPGRILDLRVLDGARGTARVVLDLSRPVRYEMRISSQEGKGNGGSSRLEVDLLNTRFLSRVREPRLSKPTIIQGVAIQNTVHGDARLILTVTEKTQVRGFLLPPAGLLGHRLVLSLAPGNPSILPKLKTQKSSPTSGKPAFREKEKGGEVIIAVDAGHGGIDPGAIGKLGTQEKTVVLSIARHLARKIDREPGFRAVMTRKEDEYLKLRARIERARTLNADFFISIHADANPDSSAIRGASVYVLSQRGASSEAAKWLAERENAADLRGGGAVVRLQDKDEVLASVLLDLSQTGTLEASVRMAESVLDALAQVGPVLHGDVQQAAFQVLRSPDIPSILVETAFLSNPIDEKNLRSERFRQRVAGVIFEGIHAYMQKNGRP